MECRSEDTVTNRFKLLRKKVIKTAKNKNFSFSECARSNDESSNTSLSSMSHMDGKCIYSNMTISERFSDLPIVIFETKSSGKPSAVSEGMIHLVSYGCVHCHPIQKKLSKFAVFKPIYC